MLKFATTSKCSQTYLNSLFCKGQKSWNELSAIKTYNIIIYVFQLRDRRHEELWWAMVSTSIYLSIYLFYLSIYLSINIYTYTHIYTHTHTHTHAHTHTHWHMCIYMYLTIWYIALPFCNIRRPRHVPNNSYLVFHCCVILAWGEICRFCKITPWECVL